MLIDKIKLMTNDISALKTNENILKSNTNSLLKSSLGILIKPTICSLIKVMFKIYFPLSKRIDTPPLKQNLSMYFYRILI